MELFNYENTGIIKQIMENRSSILQEQTQTFNEKIDRQQKEQYEEEKKQLDLENLQQDIQQQYLVRNDKCKLPEGSYKVTEKGYEEIHIPAVQK